MQDGMSLVPLSLYIKDGRVKLELAVAKGKKLYDKRASLAERDAKRSLERAAVGSGTSDQSFTTDLTRRLQPKESAFWPNGKIPTAWPLFKAGGHGGVLVSTGIREAG